MYRVLPGFLTHEEQDLLVEVARTAPFEPGRQETGYEKAAVADLDAVAPLLARSRGLLGDPPLWDAYLLRYGRHSFVPPHRDPPLPGHAHLRLNAIVAQGEGGVLALSGDPVPLGVGDAVLFRPDTVVHAVSPLTAGRRLVWSVGANVDPGAATRLLAGEG